MKNGQTTKYLNLICNIIISGMLTVGAYCAAMFAIGPVAEDTKNVIDLTACAILAIMILSSLISFALAARYEKKLSKNARAINEELTQRREYILENVKETEKKLDRIRAVILINIAVIFVLAVAIAFLAGVIGEVGLALLSLPFFVGLMSNCTFFKARPDFSNYSNPEDHKEIYALAQKAADTLGVKGRIRIFFSSANDAGIADMGKDISVILGVSMLSNLREEEMYAVLLHEFAHIKNKDRATKRRNSLMDFLNTGAASGILYALPSIMYVYEFYIYQAFSSVLTEKEADTAMAEYGDPEVAASALFKINTFELFLNNPNFTSYMGHIFYEPENAPDRFRESLSEAFFRALPEEEEFWRHLINVEIQSRSASHPILRSRIEAMGVTDPKLTYPEKEGAYREDCNKALHEIDKKVFDEISKDYEKNRKEYYLDLIETVDNWKNNGKTYSPDAVRDIICALMGLDMRDEALELCTRIAENEEGGAVAYARYMRGHILLDRYDNSGLEDIYYAIEENKNYYEEGMEKIGAYCCQMGLQAELEEYRERAVNFAQRQMDEDSGQLKATDKLSLETELPLEIAERNKNFMVNAGEGKIKNIYLVRKTVSDTYFESTYIVEFEEKTDNESINNTMNKIFEHLDNCPEDWQYNLFVYDQQTAPVAKKVKGACIYSKDEQ